MTEDDTRGGPHTVIYQADDDIFNIGPFPTREEADAAAKKAQETHEFDIYEQHVYLMLPDHRMVEYTIAELDGDNDE